MDSHRSSKSHVTAWLLVVVAVPVLYVLTMPFVAWSWIRMASPTDEAPRWLRVYIAPHGWLTDTPLREPINAYTDWARGWLEWLLPKK
jgi:hypothetical protein